VELKTLDGTAIPDILTAFNEAFSDYFIKLQLTEETIASKFRSENIDLRLSVGAFDNNRLVGFILHGYDVLHGVRTVYNAGTGVVPGFRGKAITKSLYDYCIPLLKTKGINTHLLEVIDNNYPAIKIYEQIGFKKIRTLDAFKCQQAISASDSVTIKEIKELTEAVEAFGSAKPSWQNSMESINRDIENHSLIGAFRANELIAYAAFAPATGRVRQCAVHPAHRRKGVGKSLFHYMMETSVANELLITNVDNACTDGILFLEAIGFNRILRLYEMKMEVK
jgi:ribosomal protein S18 acetylase RimI-like enzyme